MTKSSDIDASGKAISKLNSAFDGIADEITTRDGYVVFRFGGYEY